MENSLSKIHPELVSEWSERNLPVTPDDVTFGSRKVFWWKGPCGHEWQTSVKEKLRVAVMPLNEEERDLIQKVYLSDFPMSEPEYAKHIGQRRSYVNYKKRMVLEKLRAMLGSE